MPEDSQDTLAKAKVIVNRYRARGFVFPKEDCSGDDHSQSIQDVEQMRQWLRMQEMNKATGAAVTALAVLHVLCLVLESDC